jgi:MOSC domain-containing protein YiiM
METNPALTVTLAGTVGGSYRLAEPHSSGMRIMRLFLSPGHNFFGRHERAPGENPILERPRIHCVAGRGIEGDRFFDHQDNYKGQITFFSLEVFEELCAQLGVAGKSPAIARRNVITAGVDLNSLVGAEFTVQGVRFAGVEECRPCYWMDRVIAPSAEAALRGRGGLRARILTDGELHSEA